MMHPARQLLALLVLALVAGSGCSQANTAAFHTGDFTEKQPVINLGSCCIAYDSTAPVYPMYAIDPKKPTLWRPVVRPDGTPHPAGHVDDAYFTGADVHTRLGKVSPAYRLQLPPLRETGRFAVDLQRLYAGLETVRFPKFEAFDDGGLTAEGHSKLIVWLSQRYGGKVRVDRLGEGGFAVAYRVCRPDGTCRVAKIRKVLPSFAEWKRIKLAAAAGDELKRDLVMFEIAQQITRGTLWLTSDGKPMPFKVGGQVLKTPPSGKPASPPGRLVRTAPPGDRKMLAEGVVDQELIKFELSEALLARMAKANAAGSQPRIDAYASLGPGSTVTEADIRGFFDNYTQARSLGPEVRRALAFAQACQKMAKVQTIASLCVAIRREIQMPDDFIARVRGLEQMYRDSAAEVIRFTRTNFGRALGNPAADKLIREIGLDYNHGRNVGWDPRTRQFVLFDC